MYVTHTKEDIKMGRIRLGGELRDERINILVSRKTKSDLTKVAAVRRCSVNQIINEALSHHLQNYNEEIKRYNDFFGEEV